jgi:hypothetical protein
MGDLLGAAHPFPRCFLYVVVARRVSGETMFLRTFAIGKDNFGNFLSRLRRDRNHVGRLLGRH